MYIIAPTSSRKSNRSQNLQTLLQTICLRRTKDILGFPETVPEQRLVRFSDRERREYSELLQRFKENVQIAVSGRRSKVSATVLHSIHELRLFCNNGLRTAREAPQSDDELLTTYRQYDENNCARCGDSIYVIDQSGSDFNAGIFIATCKHLVCHSCYPHCFTSVEGCALCLGGDRPPWPAIENELHPYNMYEQPSEEFPSKLQALLRDLQADPTSKWYDKTDICVICCSWLIWTQHRFLVLEEDPRACRNAFGLEWSTLRFHPRRFGAEEKTCCSGNIPV